MEVWITKTEKTSIFVFCTPYLSHSFMNSASFADGQISNVLFVVFISIIGLAMLGVDVNGLFIGITGVFVSFAFMISSASSKYLEVCLCFVYISSPSLLSEG